MRRTFVLIPVLVGVAASSGCASLNKKEKGAIIGSATGAAVGAAVGRANGSTAKGAIIGAAVGGTAGAVIGHQMDQQAKEIKQNIPGAVVERVGEGLQVTFESGLLFDYNSDVLREAARKNLADTRGEPRQVSEHRCHGRRPHRCDGPGRVQHDAVGAPRERSGQLPRDEGVTRTRLRSAGRGEVEPIAQNDTEANRQKNRRVEVAIYANETLKVVRVAERDAVAVSRLVGWLVG
jgi:outer membrane protein OmpA-like peptidoglycan-associated protein